MQRILIESNIDLLDQSRLLVRLIDAAPKRPLLAPYIGHVRTLCSQMEAAAQQNLADLGHDLPSTFEAILSNTQLVASYLDLIGSRFTGPILRGRNEDDVMLAVLQWLHLTHPRTKTMAFAIADGGFAVYNPSDNLSIYFLPASRQSTLLHVPLFIHEFGHVLYRSHKPEMDELVKEFQRAVAAHALPATIRDRPGQSVDSDFRNRLVVAWYPWVQEFFCDAVGLTMGGAAYLKAFSHYLRLRSTEQYYRPRSQQLDSRHPITVLRTKLLADRARAMNLAELANAVESDWAACAKLMKAKEDYEGTWSEELLIPLRTALNDMIEEADPARWTTDIGTGGGLFKLVEQAWEKFESAPDRYAQWEEGEIQRIVKRILSGDVFGISN
jgi:hypothetical protein